MSRLSTPAARTAFIAVAVLAGFLLPGRLPEREAGAIGSIDKPYVLSTPLFTPKDGSNSTLVFASMEDSSVVVNLRRYNAVGGLLSSSNVTLGAKSSIIAFAGANSGAQMHIEIWSPTPFFTMELTYTDPGSAVQKIPYGDMMKPRTGTGLMALNLFRVCDTRSGGANCAVGKLAAGAERVVTLAGVGGVPNVGASAVVVNVQAIAPAGTGYLTVWPDGAARPNTSSINYVANENIANMLTVKLGTNGKLRVFNGGGQSHVIVDVAGYYA